MLFGSTSPVSVGRSLLSIGSVLLVIPLCMPAKAKIKKKGTNKVPQRKLNNNPSSNIYQNIIYPYSIQYHTKPMQCKKCKAQ